MVRRNTDSSSTSAVDEKKSRRRWMKAEIESVLDYMTNTIKSGKEIEKPTAISYYNELLNQSIILDCSVCQLKNQVRHLKKKFQDALDWRNQTGQGILQTDGEESLKVEILKRCPFFDQLDEIYGTRASVVPPYTHNSSADTAPTSPLSLEASSPEENNEVEEISSQDENEDSESIVQPNKTTTDLISSNEIKKRKLTPQSNCGLDALAMTARYRYECQLAETELSKEKWQYEKTRLEKSGELEREKFDFEKLMVERKLILEETKIRNEFELSKFKVEQDIKLKLELAKLERDQVK